MTETLVVHLEPAVVRCHPYRVTPDSWPGTPLYRSDWVDAKTVAKRLAAYDGPTYRCTEVYDDGIRHPDGRWEQKAKRRYLPIRIGACP